MAVFTIRARRRYAVRQPVNLRKAGGRRTQGLLIELSSEGCRISNLKRGEHQAGEEVTVEIGDVALPGRVYWAHDGVAGVRLDNALFSNQLADLVANGRADRELALYGT
jgi:hypothetical protein